MANRDKIEKLEDLIKDSIEGELIEQKATSLLPPGENYGSVMYKVDFKVKNGDKIKEYHAVAKCTPLNQVTQEVFNIQKTFKSEIAWYTTVIPTLKKFAKEHGLERDIDFFQEFYGARISLDPNSTTVDLDGVILTENLKYRGFYNVDRHQGFDAPTTYAVLRDLATFHAVSLAIRLKDPHIFDKNLRPYTSQLAEMVGETKEQMINNQLEVLEQIPELVPYKQRISETLKASNPFSSREEREPWASIVHSDFWNNNIMVQGSTKNSKTIILDLQVPSIGSGVGDLMLLLLTSVSFPVIKQQLDEFVEFYHSEFIKNVRQLGVDEKPYTIENMWKEIEIETKANEFAHAISHTQVILMNKGTSLLDSSDANFTADMFNDSLKTSPNELVLEKLKWTVLESVKRNWIL